MDKIKIPHGRYVVAVSGGVDSMVLLDVARKQLLSKNIIVAYFNHRVRSDAEAAEDRRVIADYCDKHGIKHITGVYEGEDRSEAALRDARYTFLDGILHTYGYNKIITAHHADDVIETSIINMLRGTGSAGLVSLASTDFVLRPLLHVTKSDIIKYAEKNSLEWHEDSTNADTSYLRNYVRRELMPKLNDQQLKELKDLVEDLRPLEGSIRALIDDFTEKYVVSYEFGFGIFKSPFIQLPHDVSLRLMRHWLGDKNLAVDINKQFVDKVVVFAKTAKPGARMDLSAKSYMVVTPDLVEVLGRNEE